MNKDTNITKNTAGYKVPIVKVVLAKKDTMQSAYREDIQSDLGDKM